MKKLLFCILLISFCQLSFAQDKKSPLSIEVILEKDTILIGDQIYMTADATHAREMHFHFPDVGDTIATGVLVLEQSNLDTIRNKKKEDFITVRKKYKITSYTPFVTYHMGFNFVLMDDEDGMFDTIYSNQPTLTVFPPMIDSTFVPNDIKAPVEYPLTFSEIAPYVIGGIVLLALIVFLIYYFIQRRRNQPVFFRPKPKEPPHIIAIRDLNTLKDEKLWQQGKVKEYYTKISEIIRVYIEDRFDIPAMEQTSDEILQSFISGKNCEPALLNKLKEVFYTSDLVKFAKHTPLPDENEICYKNIYDFVLQTKEEVVIPQKEEAIEETDKKDTEGEEPEQA